MTDDLVAPSPSTPNVVDGRSWEPRWIEYSRRIVTDAAHRDACAEMGGSPDDPRLVPDVRWPGYAGAAYEPGGVLWLNIIHRNLHVFGEVPPEIEGLADATRAWAAGAIDDATYLAANRAGYARGLGPDGWKVGAPVAQLLDALGQGIDQVAYANVARCQLMPETPYKSVQKRLVQFCQSWVPVRELVDVLRPGLVYTTAIEVASALTDLPGKPLVVAAGARGQRSPHGFQPRDGADRWESIAQEYERRKRTKAKN